MTELRPRSLLILNQHVSDVLGGSEMQCDLIARGLQTRGWKVQYGAVGRYRRASYSEAYPVVPVMVEDAAAFEEQVREIGPDIIYWRYGKNHLRSSMQVLRGLGIPCVMALSHIEDVRRWAVRRPRPLPGMLNHLRRWRYCLRQALASAYNHRGLSLASGVTSLNADFLPLIPHARKRCIHNTIDEQREDFSWPRPFSLWVSNIKASKRPEAYVALAKGLAAQHPQVDFLMVGRISEEVYHGYMASATAEPNIHHLGQLPPATVLGAMAQARCLVNTCLPEGFGNNFIQAWSVGCPTISLSFDPEGLITREGAGAVAGDEPRLIKQVDRVLTDQALAAAYGSRGQALYQRSFTAERMIDEVEDFLREVWSAQQGIHQT